MPRSILAALTVLALLPATAGATTYEQCIYMGATAKRLTHRIAKVQDALDVAPSARAEHRLRHTLRVLKHKRARIYDRMNRDCQNPTD